MPTELMLSLYLSNILVKFAMTFVSFPGIYLVREQPKDWLRWNENI